MITIPDALQSIYPLAEWTMHGDAYADLEWLDSKYPKPTEDEVNSALALLKAAQPLKDCKAKAKELIAATDWAVLPDVGLKNQADFVTYRGILRAYILSPVANPDFPTEPTPVWS